MRLAFVSLTVFGCKLSPFSHVVDSFLRFEKIEHEYVEVEPKKKRQMAGLDTILMPCLVVEDKAQAGNEDGKKTKKIIVKAQEIIDELQRLQGGSGRLGPFTNAQKNECMRMNEQLVPLIGLCRHLTLAASRETVAYMKEHVDEWGAWDHFWAVKTVPFFYWRRWRKMGYRVLVETGYQAYTESPPKALFEELEKIQDASKHIMSSGSSKPTVVDVWLFGLINSMRGETLFTRMQASCPKTVEWMDKLDKRF